MESSSEQIIGNKVLLRPVNESDKDLLFKWLQDPEVYKWWGKKPATELEVEEKYLGNRRPETESYIVMEKGQPMGYIQYWTDKDKVLSGGIDMFLVPESRGKGLGFDSARAMVEHLINERHWSRITVDPSKDNPDSIKFWKQVGFEFEKELSDNPDEPSVLMVYKN